MKESYQKGLIWLISGFILFTAIRKMVYIFSEVYIDIPLVSYLTDHPDTAIWVLFGISLFELIVVFLLLFGNIQIKMSTLKILVGFVIIGLIFSIVELIYFEGACFCGISKNPVISIAVKIGLFSLLMVCLKADYMEAYYAELKKS